MATQAERRTPRRDPKVTWGMEIAFDLAETAEQMMRQNLRRRNPEASEEEIERGLLDWLHKRPGAEHGDGVGRPVPLDRFQSESG